jgi:hypothetical protein
VRRGEAEAGQITKDQGKPRAPDEKFQDHHDEELETMRLIHGSAKVCADGSQKKSSEFGITLVVRENKFENPMSLIVEISIKPAVTRIAYVTSKDLG